MDKQIKIVTGDTGFGFRVMCNLSPEELKERKKEVIENFLKNLNFEVDFKLEGMGTEPHPSRDLSGYWAYMVDFHIVLK